MVVLPDLSPSSWTWFRLAGMICLNSRKASGILGTFYGGPRGNSTIFMLCAKEFAELWLLTLKLTLDGKMSRTKLSHLKLKADDPNLQQRYILS